MDLTIVGMAISYQHCPSLQSLKQFLFTGSPVKEGTRLDPVEVVIQAVNDVSPRHQDEIGIISPDGFNISACKSNLAGYFNQVIEIGSFSGSINDSLQDADRWLEGNKSRLVLITQDTKLGTSCIVLSAKNTSLPAYALLRSAEAETDLFGTGFVVFNQAFQTIPQANMNELVKLSNIVSGESQIAQIVNPTRFFEGSGINNLIFTAVAVSEKVIPQAEYIPGNEHTFSVNRDYYIPTHPRPWLSQGNDFQRSALLVETIADSQPGNALVIQEPPLSKPQPAFQRISNSDPYLFPIGGNNQEGLQKNLASFKQKLESSTSLSDLAIFAYTQENARGSAYICSIVGADRESLLNELIHAKTGIDNAFANLKSWTSPGGSYFTPAPLGASGVAFVYPGAFNSYPNMARNLFTSFPKLHELTKEIIPDLSHSLAEEFIYPRSAPQSPEAQSVDLINDIYNHPNELVESGISLSVLHTLILKNIFQIKPSSAFGYSLGEASMLWANQVWFNVEKSSQAWQNSPLFKSDLSGNMDAVRNFWKDQDLEKDFWSSYILKSSPELAAEACDNEPFVYLTIINTPGEVVIAGEKNACGRVVQELGCHALPMPFNAPMHNPAMQSCFEKLENLYTNETSPDSVIKFYSAANYQTLTLSSESLAHSMAKMTCSAVDFAKLTNQVYADGIRIFIEVGPQKTCTRWIEKILDGRPHAVVPINKKHQPDYQGVLKVISMLISHQVPMDLTPLYPGIEIQEVVPLPMSSAEVLKNNSVPISRKNHFQEQEMDPGDQTGNLGGILIKQSYLENYDKISVGIARSHETYLNQQKILTRNVARTIQLQKAYSVREAYPDPHPEPLYSKEQIIAFTIGDHRECFGNTYANFGSRRIPRLPNGYLRFIDRIMDIQPSVNNGWEGYMLNSEFDLPSQSWYRDDQSSAIPAIAIMELALQPCGFLSAYLGSIKDRVNQDLYFRNLDGEGTLLHWPEKLEGKILNQVELLSSSSLGEVIIQNYSFKLSWGGSPFYEGTSSFGYFSLPMLENQSGLDGNQIPSKWVDDNPRAGEWIDTNPQHTVSIQENDPHLPLIKRLWIAKSGGLHEQGYIYVKQSIPVQTWFYKAHFFQDPVMPGSLGVETMIQALITGLSKWGLPENVRWRIAQGQTTNWKYRGQIIPGVEELSMELHLKYINAVDQGWQVIADCHLWKGPLRIYQIENLALETY